MKMKQVFGSKSAKAPVAKVDEVIAALTSDVEKLLETQAAEVEFTSAAGNSLVEVTYAGTVLSYDRGVIVTEMCTDVLSGSYDVVQEVLVTVTGQGEVVQGPVRVSIKNLAVS